MPPSTFELDVLDRKLVGAFPGRIVRKRGVAEPA
jgi:hypothetical protein